jgi:hypothetical protein
MRSRFVSPGQAKPSGESPGCRMPQSCRSGRSNRTKHGGRLPRLQSIGTALGSRSCGCRRTHLSRRSSVSDRLQNDAPERRRPDAEGQRRTAPRVCSSAGHRLHRIRRSDVGSDNPEPSICLRGPRKLVMAPDAQMERSVMLKKRKHYSGGAADSPTPSWQQGSPRSGMRTNHRRSDQRPGGKGQDRGTCQPNPVLVRN